MDRRFVPIALLAPLAGCLATPEHAERAAPAPRFDVAAFFAGESHGSAQLRVLWRRPVPVRVDSRGRTEPDGTIVLDQRIVEGAHAPRTRRWRLREIAPGRWTGTLTDASGPVTGTVMGNCLTLAYPMRHGLRVRQWLYLQPGGRVARNGLAVEGWGVRIATLDETIVRR